MSDKCGSLSKEMIAISVKLSGGNPPGTNMIEKLAGAERAAEIDAMTVRQAIDRFLELDVLVDEPILIELRAAVRKSQGLKSH